ncbi:uncharacterized protein LOC129224244 [Uloborus diversus]|uniref:uncharacterized protein LOC129224244 n=1 Tax=Uloborus diversus TaxID=327109 RepID=UPI002409E7B2|nr:uncharacterized protein LOC129224244 [Uloborus diversus]
MIDLKVRLDQNDYNKFVTEGFFTIRRSDKFWCGLWTDMTIEQTLMRSMKSTGGLTRGRGISDSTMAKWILSMPILVEVSQKVEEFCNLSFVSTEQHADAKDSRITRDEADVQKLVNWFSSHDPFPNSEHLMSISNGIVADESINCHNAYEIGTDSLSKIVGNNFADVKLKRKNRVMPIRGSSCKVKVHDEFIPVNPDTIFRRISLLKKSDEELQNYFAFELAPFPLSLFDEEGLHNVT